MARKSRQEFPVIAVDTNLLLYALFPQGAEHTLARTALLRAQADERGWGFTVANASEFWSVATRVGGERAPATPAEAVAFLASLIRAGAQLWQGQADFGLRLLAIASRGEILGRRIFDLQIALAARDNGATEIWTHDRGFVAVAGLRVFDPLG